MEGEKESERSDKVKDKFSSEPLDNFEKRIKKSLDKNRKSRKMPSALKKLINYIEAEDGSVSVSIENNGSSQESSIYKSFSIDESSRYVSFEDSLNDDSLIDDENIPKNCKNINSTSRKMKTSLYDSLEDICSLVSSVEKFTPPDENEFLASMFEKDSLRHQTNYEYMSSSAKFEDDSLAVIGLDKSFDDSLEDLNALKNVFEDADICIKNIRSDSPHVKRNLFETSFEVVYERKEDEGAVTIEESKKDLCKSKNVSLFSENCPISRDSLEESLVKSNSQSSLKPKSTSVHASQFASTNPSAVSVLDSQDDVPDSEHGLWSRLEIETQFSAMDERIVDEKKENLPLKFPPDVFESTSILWDAVKSEGYSEEADDNVIVTHKTTPSLKSKKVPQTLPSNVKSKTLQKLVEPSTSKSPNFRTTRNNSVKSVYHDSADNVGCLWNINKSEKNLGNSSNLKHASESKTNKGENKNLKATVPKYFSTSLKTSQDKKNTQSELGELWQDVSEDSTSMNHQIDMPRRKESALSSTEGLFQNSAVYKELIKKDHIKVENPIKDCIQVNEFEKITCEDHFEDASDDLCLVIKNVPSECNVKFNIEVEINSSTKPSSFIQEISEDEILLTQSKNFGSPSSNASDIFRRNGAPIPFGMNLHRSSSVNNSPKSTPKINFLNKELSPERLLANQLLQALDLHDTSVCVEDHRVSPRNSIKPMNLCVRDTTKGDERALGKNDKENIPTEFLSGTEISFSDGAKIKTSPRKCDKRAIPKQHSTTKIPILLTPISSCRKHNLETENQKDVAVEQIPIVKSATVDGSERGLFEVTPHKPRHFCMVRNSISRVPTSLKTPSKKYKYIESPVAKYVRDRVVVTPLKLHDGNLRPTKNSSELEADLKLTSSTVSPLTCSPLPTSSPGKFLKKKL